MKIEPVFLAQPTVENESKGLTMVVMQISGPVDKGADVFLRARELVRRAGSHEALEIFDSSAADELFVAQQNA
jgi:hypothetical protein